MQRALSRFGKGSTEGGPQGTASHSSDLYSAFEIYIVHSVNAMFLAQLPVFNMKVSPAFTMQQYN